MASLLHLLLTCSSFTFISHSQAKKSTYLPTKTENVLNPIDSCWRSDPLWSQNRQSLADCAVGFGQAALGGKFGSIYTVTTPEDDPVDPKPGTLRYGVIQTEPLWIIFEQDMVIELDNELIINSFKTIDGRGAKVEITNGPCLTIEGVSHVIVHGISIHGCKPGKSGLVRSSASHVGHRLGCDGDGIAVYGSTNIWIDHCYFSDCSDGMIDVTHASTAVTVSNNYFTHHDKVMLLGHNDAFSADVVMKVSVVFNHFGPGLVQRMPRVRYGYAHVANNRYDEWEMYAIGGSADPTIFSEGNYFVAANDENVKEVTKREVLSRGWKNWKWRSSRDVFTNGAYFVQSGYGSCSPLYTADEAFTVEPGALAPALTSQAGPLSCFTGKSC